MQSYDLIVIGLGAMGSATVLQSAKRGISVLGLDQYTPPHPWGSTHGNSRIIREAYYEGSEYTKILQRAYKLWAELESTSGEDFLQIIGGLFFGPEDAICVKGTLDSALTYQLPHEYFDAKELMYRYPCFKVPEAWKCVLDKRAGILHPEKAVQAQLKLAEQAGATLLFGQKVEGWQVRPNYIEVRTQDEVFLSKQIVIVTNAWAKPLSESLGISLNTDRVVQYWVEPKVGNYKNYTPDKLPIWLMESSNNMEFYGFPWIEGNPSGLKVALYPIGPTPYRHICTPWDIEREILERDHTEIRGLIQKYAPAFDGKFIEAKTCMHVNTADMHPIIGRHPQHNNVWLCYGFSGHGFKFSNVIGEMMADLVESGNSDWWLPLFDPQRFNLTNPVSY